MSYSQMLTVSARWRAQAILLLSLTFLINIAAQGQSLPPEVSRAWGKTGLPDSSLSMIIEEVDGERLAAFGAGNFKNPASVMKLLTTWSALSELGPDYVWRTAFLMGANAVVNDNGVLSGPLYLRPSGDPLFLLQDLWRLMRELRLRGITQISDIVIDRSKFGDIAINPGDFDGKGDRPYNASPDVLMVGFGAVRLVFTPDLNKQRWRAFIDPPIAGVKIDSNLRYRTGACRNGPQVSSETITSGDQVSFRISGTATGSCGEFDMYRLAFSQSDFAAKALESMWTELGGQMTGIVKEGAIAPDAVPLAAHQSPPLAEVIRVVNKSSNNVMTRVLLLTIASELGQQPATVEGGVQRVLQTLQSQGISTEGVVIENGSGLARSARISADQVAKMLQVAWRSPAMPEYVSSLAILGTDGTLRRRLRGDARGYAHMKTGALRDSRAIAGYVLSQSGKRYVFVSLVNDPQAFKARGFENQVIDWLTSR